MSDFDDLVSAERRRIDEQAAARAATESARRQDDLPEWRQVVARIRELLAASARHLRDAGVPPVPVLEEGGTSARLENMGLVLAGRVRIVGRLWPIEIFALDAEGRAYPMTRPLPLLHFERASTTVKDRKKRRARLRTGLAADAPVMWAGAGSPCRVPYDLDPAVGAQNGRIGCFGKGEDGSGLIIPTLAGSGQPLEPFLAKEVARRIAEHGAG